VRIIATIIAAAYTTAAHAKYGDIVGDSDSSGSTGLIIFGLICAAGYLWYRQSQKGMQDRIAQREREEALREELKSLKNKD
jgi:hypothetical protein